MSDPSLHPRIAAAVREILADARRFVAPGIVEARGVERLMQIIESDERRPAERMRRENESALQAMEDLGNTRDSAWKVAKRFSSDPHTREILAQRFRRLRREKTKRALFG